MTGAVATSHDKPAPRKERPPRPARRLLGTFGPASEEPYRRRPRDAVRVGAAAVILFLLARHVGDVTPTERTIFEFFNTLPDGLQTLFISLYRLGALWAVGLVAGAALLDRRWRLARDLALAGGLAWGIARIVGVFVAEDNLRKSIDAITRLGDTPSFPVVRLAIVTAVIAAAAPYVARPVRRIGSALVVLLGLAALYLGTGSPNDALAAVVLGWGVGALVHLALGSPGGRPTTPQIEVSLEQLAVAAEGLHVALRQPVGSTLMLARDDQSELSVKVIGRDEADAQLIAKLWRFMAYKDSGPVLFVNRLHQVEHEAYQMLLAAQAGVRVPQVVIAGTAGPGAALLVSRRLDGELLSELEPTVITDDLLRAVWDEVGTLHRARIAHGRMNTAQVVVTKDGPAIVDFATSSTWTMERGDDDIAELLASTAALVGEERAIDAAVAGLGRDTVAAALPFLQTAALGRQTRALTGDGRKEVQKRLDQLRSVGATKTGSTEPELQELYRVKPTNVLMAVGTLVALIALLSQVGDPGDAWNTVKDANWWWVALAFLLSMATNIGFAIALLGTVPIRLTLGPSIELQVAMSFSNLAIPAVGGTALQIRFLQKHGADLPTAVAAGGLLATVANFVTQLGLFAVAAWLAPNRIDTNAIPTSGIAELLLGLALVVGIVIALLLGVPKLRRLVLPPLKHVVEGLWRTVRSPRRLALLIGGNVIAAMLAAACLLTCLEAFGSSLSFWTLLALNIGIGTIASLVPIPGGGTAVSSIGLSGALVAFGVPKEVAVAAVLTNQIVMTYLPAIPGWFATQHLIKRDEL